jgi:putative hemolysin
MQPFAKGRYLARMAETQADLHAAQRLRWICFLSRNGASASSERDADDLDARYRHVLIEDIRDHRLVCCFRFLPLSDGSRIGRSYSAQFYNLGALERFDGPMIELGRFCVDPQTRDPDIIRTAWAAITRHVDETGTQMLFGCSSFTGTEPDDHAEAFAMLKERHLAPRRWLPPTAAPLDKRRLKVFTMLAAPTWSLSSSRTSTSRRLWSSRAEAVETFCHCFLPFRVYFLEVR